MQYRLKEYATMLSPLDVREMFMQLVKISGSISESARRCGIERTGVYDWPKASDMRLQTKVKILQCLMEEAPDEALAFVLERSRELTVGVLRTLLGTIYEWAMSEDTNQEQLRDYIETMLRICEDNQGLVLYEMEEGAEEMRKHLKQKARELSVPFPKRTIYSVKARDLVSLLPSLIQAIMGKSVASEEIAKDFDIPLGFVKMLSETLIEAQRRIASADKRLPEQALQIVFADTGMGQKLSFGGM